MKICYDVLYRPSNSVARLSGVAKTLVLHESLSDLQSKASNARATLEACHFLEY